MISISSINERKTTSFLQQFYTKCAENISFRLTRSEGDPPTSASQKINMFPSTLFHLVATLQFGYGCYYDFYHVNVPGQKSVFGGKFKYLTYLNAVIITVYFTVALLNDIFGNNDNEPTTTEKPLIRRVRDVMFCSLTFPLSLFVGITFWSIYAIDRELILPRVLDEYFPFWLNHVMHTNIILFTLLDLATSFRMYPNRKLGLSILSTFMVFYLLWIHVIYINTGRWVYPILSVLNWPMKILFYCLSLSLTVGAYRLGEILNDYVWHKEVEQNVRSGKKKRL